MKNTFNLIVFISFFIGSIFAQNGSNEIKTFPAANGENLQISIDPGNINIETWNNNEVYIEITSKDEYKIEELKAEKSGETIKYILELEDGWDNNVTLKVKTPTDFNFNIETTGGNISISNNILGILKANTEGGNISFKSVNGKVNVKTSGGNISGKNVEGNIRLHTSGGNISIGNVVSGKAEIDTYGGNISVGSVDSDLSAKTHGGNIKISDVGGNADAFTYGGNISMNKVSGSAKMETYGGHIKLYGASGAIVAKTKGGNIKLKNITGHIDATTSAGNIQAELFPKGNTKSTLKTYSGNVKLKIPQKANSEIDVLVRGSHLADLNDAIKSEFKTTSFNINQTSDEVKAKFIINNGSSKIQIDCYNGNVKIINWDR